MKSFINGIRGEPSSYLKTSTIRSWSIEDAVYTWTSAAVNNQDKSIYLVDSLKRYVILLLVTLVPKSV